MWEQAESDYMAGMKYKEIAEKYNVSLSTVKSWKTRYKWNRKGTHTKSKKVRVQNEKSTHTKPSANATSFKKGNRAAAGHGAPPKNQNATKHGLFAKYLPKETFEIAERLEIMNPIDILWENIKIQYAVILRAQRIMHVKDKDDLTKEIAVDGMEMTSYELQFAWDKQAAFMVAQSKAMTTLNNMIKQYDELCKSDLATEEQKLRIEKLKLDIKLKSGDVTDENDSSQDGFKAALLGQVKNVWGDEE